MDPATAGDLQRDSNADKQSHSIFQSGIQSTQQWNRAIYKDTLDCLINHYRWSSWINNRSRRDCIWNARGNSRSLASSRRSKTALSISSSSPSMSRMWWGNCLWGSLLPELWVQAATTQSRQHYTSWCFWSRLSGLFPKCRDGF